MCLRGRQYGQRHRELPHQPRIYLWWSYVELKISFHRNHHVVWHFQTAPCLGRHQKQCSTADQIPDNVQFSSHCQETERWRLGMTRRLAQVKASCTHNLDLSRTPAMHSRVEEELLRRHHSEQSKDAAGILHDNNCVGHTILLIASGYLLGVCVVADVGQHRISARRECYIPCHKHVQTAISGAAFLDELTHFVAGSVTVLDAAADMHDGAARWERMGRHGQPPTKQSVHRD